MNEVHKLDKKTAGWQLDLWELEIGKLPSRGPCRVREVREEFKE